MSFDISALKQRDCYKQLIEIEIPWSFYDLLRKNRTYSERYIYSAKIILKDYQELPAELKHWLGYSSLYSLLQFH